MSETRPQALPVDPAAVRVLHGRAPDAPEPHSRKQMFTCSVSIIRG